MTKDRKKSFSTDQTHDEMIKLRVAGEIKAQAIAVSSEKGLTLSEYLRNLMIADMGVSQ